MENTQNKLGKADYFAGLLITGMVGLAAYQIVKNRFTQKQFWLTQAALLATASTPLAVRHFTKVEPTDQEAARTELLARVRWAHQKQPLGEVKLFLTIDYGENKPPRGYEGIARSIDQLDDVMANLLAKADRTTGDSEKVSNVWQLIAKSDDKNVFYSVIFAHIPTYNNKKNALILTEGTITVPSGEQPTLEHTAMEVYPPLQKDQMLLDNQGHFRTGLVEEAVRLREEAAQRRATPSVPFMDEEDEV